MYERDWVVFNLLSLFCTFKNSAKVSKNIQVEYLEKKRIYLQRVMEIERGSFTPFGTNGGTGKKCETFLWGT